MRAERFWESHYLPLGEAIGLIQSTLGWNATRMARELGTSARVFFRTRHRSSPPSLAMVNRIREITGFDPYIIAYCMSNLYANDTPEIVKAATDLKVALQRKMLAFRQLQAMALIQPNGENNVAIQQVVSSGGNEAGAGADAIGQVLGLPSRHS